MHHGPGMLDDIATMSVIQHRTGEANARMKKMTSQPPSQKRQPKMNKAATAARTTPLYRCQTTLHPWAVEGPFNLEGTTQIWYCDNKQCRHTKHGVYKNYNIPNWRSVQLGTKFVICDGCVRDYPPPSAAAAATNPPPTNPAAIAQPVGVGGAQQINVNLQLGGGGQMGGAASNEPQKIRLQFKPEDIAALQSGQAVQPNVTVLQTGGDGGGAAAAVNPVMSSNAVANTAAQATTGLKDAPQKPQLTLTMPTLPYYEISDKQPMVVKEGWMLKQGGIMKNWKKRYFVMHNDKQLYYYDSDKSATIKGVAQFYRCNAIRKTGQQSFEVETNKRVWAFACKNPTIRDEWVYIVSKITGRRVT